jgi:plastocyanin
VKRLPLLAVIAAGLAALSLGLSACGDDSSSADETTTQAAPATTAPTTTAPATTSGSTAAKVLKLQADPSGALKYVQTTLTATAGAVDIAFTNDSAVPHDVTIEGKGSSEIISGGKTSDLKIADLPAGTYTYYCSVPGHEQAGMKGTLTVN